MYVNKVGRTWYEKLKSNTAVKFFIFIETSLYLSNLFLYFYASAIRAKNTRYAWPRRKIVLFLIPTRIKF